MPDDIVINLKISDRGVSGEIAKLKKVLEDFDQRTTTKNVRGELDSFRRAAQLTQREVSSSLRLIGVSGAIIGGGIVASVAGAGKALTDFSRNALQLNYAANQLGTSAETLRRFEYAGKAIGLVGDTAAREAQGAMRKIQDAFWRPVGNELFTGIMQGFSAESSARFYQEIMTALGESGDVEKAFTFILNRMNEWARAGNWRAVEQMGRILNLSPGSYRLVEVLKEFPRVVMPDVQAAQAFQAELAKLEVSATNMGRSVGIALIPTFTELFTRLRTWLDGAEGKEFEKQMIALGQALGTVPWDDIGRGVSGIAGALAKGFPPDAKAEIETWLGYIRKIEEWWRRSPEERIVRAQQGPEYWRNLQRPYGGATAGVAGMPGGPSGPAVRPQVRTSRGWPTFGAPVGEPLTPEMQIRPATAPPAAPPPILPPPPMGPAAPGVPLPQPRPPQVPGAAPPSLLGRVRGWFSGASGAQAAQPYRFMQTMSGGEADGRVQFMQLEEQRNTKDLSDQMKDAVDELRRLNEMIREGGVAQAPAGGGRGGWPFVQGGGGAGRWTRGGRGTGGPIWGGAPGQPRSRIFRGGGPGGLQPEGGPGAVSKADLRSNLEGLVANSELNGFVPPDGEQYGIKTGSPQEWAHFLTELAGRESSYNPRTHGDVGRFGGAGSHGLFQLSPQDALTYGLQDRPFTLEQLRDPDFNARMAVRITAARVRAGGISGREGLAKYFGPIGRGWRPGPMGGGGFGGAGATGNIYGLNIGGQMQTPLGLLVHHTGGRERTPEQVAAVLRGRTDAARGGLSVQYFIDRAGNIFQMTPEGRVAYHAGRLERTPGLGNINLEGVEVAARGERDVTSAQRRAIAELYGQRRAKFGEGYTILGHGEATGRKERTEGATARMIREGLLPVPARHGEGAQIHAQAAHGEGARAWSGETRANFLRERAAADEIDLTNRSRITRSFQERQRMNKVRGEADVNIKLENSRKSDATQEGGELLRKIPLTDPSAKQVPDAGNEQRAE